MRGKLLTAIAAAGMLLISGCGGSSGGDTSTSVVPSPAPAPSPTPTTDPCAVTKTTKAYPPSYLGTFPIPSAAGKLPANIVRMMDTKDYYPNVDPAISGCSDRILYSRNLYKEELNRLQEDGAQVVWITNYGQWLDLTQVPWVLDETSVQIPASEFEFLVSEIKKRGMKAYFYWQMWGLDAKGNEYPMGKNFTPLQLKNWMTSHRNLMINLAKLSAKLGIDGLGVDWQAYYIPNLYEDEMKEYYISELSKTIDEIKKNYSGDLILGLNGHIFSDPRLISKVNYIRLSIGPQISEGENRNLSVAFLKKVFIQKIAQFREDLGDISNYQNHLKVEFQFAIQSRDRYFVEGWVEDGFCVSGKNGDDCIQKSYVTDYSVQAIGAEAAFEAVTEQKDFPAGAFTIGTYWHTDDMTPGNYGRQSDFPNLSASIRNKPAENIVKYWFK